MWITVLVMAIAVSMEPFPHRNDVADAEQAEAGATTARIPQRRFCDGSDRGSGRHLRVSARSPGVCALHLAQGPDRDRRLGCADGRPAGQWGDADAQGPCASTRSCARPVAVGRDSGGSGDRAAVHRLPGGARRHRRIWRRPSSQVGALLVFNVIAFAFVELPLVAYLLAPDRTRSLMAALNDWIRSRRRRGAAAVLAVVGCVLLVAGIAGF
jgi:Sap, sulfolipid-1-addressing protein